MGTEPALPLEQDTDLIPGVSFPRRGRPRWLLVWDLEAWFEAEREMQNQLEGEKQGAEACALLQLRQSPFRRSSLSRSHGLGSLQLVRATSWL